MTYEGVAAALEPHGAVAKKMMGHPCLFINGKGFAGDFDASMIFKLCDPERAQALALPGAQLFDPMGGRPMREWVQVPAAHSEQWLQLAEAAMQYVVELQK